MRTTVGPVSTLGLSAALSLGLLVEIIGGTFGSEEPYIPSAYTYAAVTLCIPLVIGAIFNYFMLTERKYLQGETPFRRQVQTRGVVGATLVVLGMTCVIIVFVSFIARLGWLPATAYPAQWTSKGTKRIDALFVDTGAVQSRHSMFERLIFRQVGSEETEEVAWPKDKVAVLGKCPDKAIVLTGVSGPIGIVIQEITCASAHSHT